MSAIQFFSAFTDILHRIEETQLENIRTAASWTSRAIMADRFAVLFGTGHSAIATMDAYPRIGSYPGWLPIHELSTTYTSRMSGNQGLRQAIFLEKVEGFGSLMLQNYALTPQDVMVVVSNSGVNTMGVEVALEARKMGLKTIAITSIDHSNGSTSYHSSGKRLCEISDLVLDNCVPAGDALVQVPGFPAKVAAASTIASCIILQALAAETATMMSDQEYIPPVFPSHNNKLSLEETEKVEGMVEAIYYEDARRYRKIIR